MSKKVDLRNLDTSNPGSWPLVVKIFACLFLAAFIIAGAWYFFVADRRTELEGLVAKQETL
jgi:type IV pilus assembly protein PilO